MISPVATMVRGQPVDPDRLLGLTVEDVRTAWHKAGTGEPTLVGLWLRLSVIGWLELLCSAGGDIALTEAVPPDEGYGMEQYGRVELEQRPVSFPLTSVIGDCVLGVTLLRLEEQGWAVGLVLRFRMHSSIGIANLGDDLAVRPWPSPHWDAAGIIGPDSATV